MDNTAATKAAWHLLRNAYFSMFFHGCPPHGLHLFVKDIFSATKTKRGSDFNSLKYPDGYLFNRLLMFTNEVKDILKFFHNHHAPKTQLLAALSVAKLENHFAPAPTCWGHFKVFPIRFLMQKRFCIPSSMTAIPFKVLQSRKNPENLFRTQSIAKSFSLAEELAFDIATNLCSNYIFSIVCSPNIRHVQNVYKETRERFLFNN